MITEIAVGDFAHCEATAHARGGSFHRAFDLLPHGQRQALFAIYAWMRSADDLIDEGIDGARGALDTFVEHTGTLLDGTLPLDEPMWRAMAAVHAQWVLPRAPFKAMLEGQRRDLEGCEILNDADLETYCQCVGSSVGCLCMHVWGCTDRAGFENARRLGIAFQLTNILRDIGEDLRRGRCYLPLPDGVTRDMLIGWHPPQACSELLLHWAMQAESHYEAASGLEQYIDPSCRATLTAMTGIYRGMLRQLMRTPKRSVLGPRAGLSRARRLGVVLGAKLTVC